MTRPGIKRPPRRPPTPLTTMAIGATFTRTFPTGKQRDEFRGNVAKRGRQIGRKFQRVTDGLTVTVMRIG